MANAGVMNQPSGLTADGYELQFGTIFLSPTLLIQKFLPLMDKIAKLPGADVRVVQLTSTGFRGAPSYVANSIDRLFISSLQEPLQLIA